MKFRFLATLLLFISADIIAQQRAFYGRVSDKDNVGIPFAIIQSTDGNIGTYTDDNGIFYLELDPIQVNGLRFSCVGYEKKEILVKNWENDSIRITLDENPLTISEVVVAAKLGELKEAMLGNNDLEYKGQVYFDIGDEMAVFLPAERKNRKKRGFLKEVYIYVTKIGIEDSRFRIHVYDQDPETGMPKNDITTDNIIVYASSGNEWLRVDLSKYKIPVRNGGVYVGIEWISGYGNDPKKRWRRGLFTYNSPVVGFTQSYGGKHKRFCRLGFSQQWRDCNYKKYRLRPMVYGSYTYRENN